MKDKIDKLKQLLGSALISLIEYENGIEIQYILVVKDFKFSNCPQLRKLIKKFKTLIFTREDFIGGIDVFPIDMALMKQNHLLLHGEDLLTSIKVDNQDLRHHLEYSLRSQRIHLKTEATYSGTKEIVKSIYSTIYPNLAAAVIYKRGELPEGETLHKELSEAFSVDTTVLNKLKSYKQHDRVELIRDTDKLLSDLINKIN